MISGYSVQICLKIWGFREIFASRTRFGSQWLARLSTIFLSVDKGVIVTFVWHYHVKCVPNFKDKGILHLFEETTFSGNRINGCFFFFSRFPNERANSEAEMIRKRKAISENAVLCLSNVCRRSILNWARTDSRELGPVKIHHFWWNFTVMDFKINCPLFCESLVNT